jgi:hypothetical protein
MTRTYTITDHGAAEWNAIDSSPSRSAMLREMSDLRAELGVPRRNLRAYEEAWPALAPDSCYAIRAGKIIAVLIVSLALLAVCIVVAAFVDLRSSRWRKPPRQHHHPGTP